MDLDTLIANADPARHRELDRAGSAAAERLYRQITGAEPARRPLGGWRLARQPARRRPAGPGPRVRPAVVVGATVVAAAAIAASVLAWPADPAGGAGPGASDRRPRRGRGARRVRRRGR